MELKEELSQDDRTSANSSNPIIPSTPTPPTPLPCCFFFKYGKCEPDRPPCRFSHVPDDQITPCNFGATCRFGHKKRVLPDALGEDEKARFWTDYRKGGKVVGDAPALRDAMLLRSQLEPWPTATLRERLVSIFSENHRELDLLDRGTIMDKLLAHYEESGPRKMIRVNGAPVREDLRNQLLDELKKWRERHTSNNRPSINAQSYMILRTPMEFGAKDSNKATAAKKKLEQNSALYELARTAITEIDPSFASNFSALAVTYGFTGSPHIDKQNSGPFYGLALGDFNEGEGGVCVEASPFVVAHVNTKNRLGKVDGRHVHWVAPYSGERYSLIYYSTHTKYENPGPAYFGEVEKEEEEATDTHD
jgi:hypothetical protein